ncbi:hypothetical protein AVEN_53500-1 [Araneus ventricosus]|uniref:Uncharacterized protein n=1 Tax=Araneus ventricosus TaxID=182803 RepID=A0A4Y2JCU1_ARAVE|nr:hypothetical protein AVEN_53500-1 [Araneus ventricosus]
MASTLVPNSYFNFFCQEELCKDSLMELPSYFVDSASTRLLPLFTLTGKSCKDSLPVPFTGQTKWSLPKKESAEVFSHNKIKLPATGTTFLRTESEGMGASRYFLKEESASNIHIMTCLKCRLMDSNKGRGAILRVRIRLYEPQFRLIKIK